MSRIARAVGVAAATVAAATLPLFVAAPAQADTRDCVKYLAEKEYFIGPAHNMSCKAGEGLGVYHVCLAGLLGLGVSNDDADRACRLARDEEQDGSRVISVRTGR